MQIMYETSRQFGKSYAHKLDNWLKLNGVTIDNINKFRLEIKYGTPEFAMEKNEDSYCMKGRLNTIYRLFPKRGRNAKRMISDLYL